MTTKFVNEAKQKKGDVTLPIFGGNLQEIQKKKVAEKTDSQPAREFDPKTDWAQPKEKGKFKKQ